MLMWNGLKQGLDEHWTVKVDKIKILIKNLSFLILKKISNLKFLQDLKSNFGPDFGTSLRLRNLSEDINAV